MVFLVRILFELLFLIRFLNVVVILNKQIDPDNSAPMDSICSFTSDMHRSIIDEWSLYLKVSKLLEKDGSLPENRHDHLRRHNLIPADEARSVSCNCECPWCSLATQMVEDRPSWRYIRTLVRRQNVSLWAFYSVDFALWFVKESNDALHQGSSTPRVRSEKIWHVYHVRVN